MEKEKGITLVVLVVTIVVLLILASVTILTVTGEKGILKKSSKAKEENDRQTATEMITLKITNAQIQSYKDEQKMPDLQYLANRLCEDSDMEYVKIKDKKVASLENKFLLPPIKIETGEDTILTKLNDYPYEFEINGKLRLSSIDGVKVEDISRDMEIEEIKTIMNSYQAELQELKNTIQTMQNSKKTTLIRKDWGKSTLNVNASWRTLEKVSLSGYGKGKAIISYSVSSEVERTTRLSAMINDGSTLGQDDSFSNVSLDYMKCSTSATVAYDENTKINFSLFSDLSIYPYYTYSILLIPD